jgi:VIT1/CCC1 family predicted Fe2+/Mn2+ transporter
MSRTDLMRTWQLESPLDPGTRLGEILFGLIMTLTFTLGAGVLFGGELGDSRELLRATLGCNVAWGIIDAVLFILGLMFDRSRLARLGRAIASTNDAAEARALVASELDEAVASFTATPEREAFYDHVAAHIRTTSRRAVTVTGADMRAAISVFVTVATATLPAAVPFMFIDEPMRALRTSNAVLIALLFAVGYRWAKYTNVGPWIAGIGMMTLGVILVAIAIPLGG